MEGDKKKGRVELAGETNGRSMKETLRKLEIKTFDLGSRTRDVCS